MRMGEQKEKTFFPEIQGYRTLLNFWVVLCHCAGILKYFALLNVHQDPSRVNYVIKEAWITVCIALGYQVDVFFVLSGFVLAYPMLSKPLCNQAESSLSAVYQSITGCLIMALKKVLRFYPAIIGTMLITVLIKDYNSDNLEAMLSQLLFLPLPDRPIAFAPLWSNFVDLLCSICLYFTIYFMQYFDILNYSTAWIMVFVSFIPKCWRFFTSVPRISYLQLNLHASLADKLIPVYMSAKRAKYYQEVLYPHVFDYLPQAVVFPLKAIIMTQEYIVYHQRITPFFIGLLLAVVMIQAWKKSTSTKEFLEVETYNKRSTVFRVAYHIFHFICLLLSILLASQPYLFTFLGKKDPIPDVLAELAKDNRIDIAKLPAPPAVADFFISAANRPLFAAAFAYLLYRSMLPSTHTLHISILSKFLTWRPFQWLSTYTYAIYVIHMKVLHEIMFGYMYPTRMNALFGAENVFLQFVVWMIVTYSASLALGMALHHGLEVPILNWGTKLIKSLEISLVASAKKDHATTKKLD